MAVKLLVIPDPQLWIYQTYLLLTVAGRFQPLINNAAGIALDIVAVLVSLPSVMTRICAVRPLLRVTVKSLGTITAP